MVVLKNPFDIQDYACKLNFGLSVTHNNDDWNTKTVPAT